MKQSKKPSVILFMLICLCALMAMPVTAEAAKLKTVNIDKYAKLSKSYTVFAYNPSSRWVNIRASRSTKARRYGEINYGGALVVKTSALKKGQKTAWIPVYLYNRRTKNGYQTGYVLASQVKLQSLYTKKFSTNKIVNTAIKTGFKYLGTPFEMPGASLANGIDCAQFAAAIYRTAGRGGLGTHTDYLQAACWEVFYNRTHQTLTNSQMKKLKAGDLLFYLKDDTSGPIDHVAVYIGGGFMINSSGHYGEVYPNGGISIKRVQYGNRKIVRAMRLYGI